MTGDLEQEIYKRIPPGSKENDKVGRVCKLGKSLYGLKQSPRTWLQDSIQLLPNWDIDRIM